MRRIIHMFVCLREYSCSLLIALLPNSDFMAKHKWILYKASGLNIGRTKIIGSLDIRPYCGFRNIRIGSGGFINVNFRIAAPGDVNVMIGDQVLIGPNVSLETVSHSLILDGDGRRSATLNDINIGNSVWVAANVVILPGVTIGNGVVIAAGSVVTHDLVPFSLYAGVPARRIRGLEIL